MVNGGIEFFFIYVKNFLFQKRLTDCFSQQVRIICLIFHYVYEFRLKLCFLDVILAGSRINKVLINVFLFVCFSLKLLLYIPIILTTVTAT
jgi:hypothetical protein